MFAGLWVSFAAGLIWHQGSLDAARESMRSLPLVVQGLGWLLFLPVVAGRWVWSRAGRFSTPSTRTRGSV